MNATASSCPTREQMQCANALVSLLRAGVPHADALALIRLLAQDGNTERTKTIGAFVASGIPFADAESYADDAGMRVALLTALQTPC